MLEKNIHCIRTFNFYSSHKQWFSFLRYQFVLYFFFYYYHYTLCKTKTKTKQKLKQKQNKKMKKNVYFDDINIGL